MWLNPTENRVKYILKHVIVGILHYTLKGFVVSELLAATEFPVSSVGYLDPTLKSSGKTFTQVSTALQASSASRG